MNRQSRRRAERAVGAAGEQPAKGKPQPETVGEQDSRKPVQPASGNRRGTGQPEAGAIRVRKPSGNGDSRKPEQPASENRRGTGTAGNRNRRQTADRPRQAAIRGGFAARSRDSPKQEYEKRPCNPAYAGVARPLSVYKRTNSTWCPSSSGWSCRRRHRNHGP